MADGHTKCKENAETKPSANAGKERERALAEVVEGYKHRKPPELRP